MSSSAAVQAAVHRAHQLLAPSHTQGSPPIGPGVR